MVVQSDILSDGGGWDRAGLAPALALRVFGLRRSGNHAIIDWLCRNSASAGTVFFNNCIRGRDPLTAHRGAEINRNWRKLPVDGGPGALRAALAEAGSDPMVVISYEDTVPPADRSEKPVSHKLPDSAFDHQIVIYRGFLNWAASLLHKIQRNPAYTAVQRGLIMLRAVRNYDLMLQRLEGASAFALTGICYDRWVASAAYRRDLLASLGLPEKDNDLGAVPHYGGGSSFQPDAETGAELQTDRRSAAMATDPEYRMILWLAAQDPEFIARLRPGFPDDAAHLSDLAARPAPEARA